MGYGGRRLGGFTHKEAEATIPDTAMIWFDEEGEGSPSYAPFSVLKTLVGTALAPTAPAYAPVVMAALPQSLSGAGAVNVTSSQTNFTSSGAAQALTLADGTIVGQLKTVTHVVDGGEGVLTPVNFADGATITFTAAFEEWTGLWTGTTWQTTKLTGITSLPVIA